MHNTARRFYSAELWLCHAGSLGWHGGASDEKIVIFNSVLCTVYCAAGSLLVLLSVWCVVCGVDIGNS